MRLKESSFLNIYKYKYILTLCFRVRRWLLVSYKILYEKYLVMPSFLSESSSVTDVVVWLRNNKFNDEVIKNFQGLFGICALLSY